MTPAKVHPPNPDLRVSFVLLDRFTLLPLSCLVDIFRHAADEYDRSRQIYCQWNIHSHDYTPIISSCGFAIAPTKLHSDMGKLNYVIVLGGLMPMALQASPDLRKFIQEAHTAGTTIVGVDNGVALLAQLGLLTGKSCALHFNHKEEITALFPDIHPVVDHPLVDLGDVITCSGGVRAVDLGAHLVARHCGRARARKALRQMLVDPEQISYSSAQVPYRNLADCGDWRIEKAVDIMEQNLSSPMPVKELAGILGISTRSLSRAFTEYLGESPTSVFRNIRLHHSRWLLLNTNRTMVQIAYECGFSDSAHFCRRFQKTYKISPSSFRKSRRELTATTSGTNPRF